MRDSLALLAIIVATACNSAFAVTFQGAQPPSSSCESNLLTAQQKSDKLLRIGLIGTVHFPQATVGTNFILVSAILGEPELVRVILRPLTKDQLAEVARRMDLAHAAHGVNLKAKSTGDGPTHSIGDDILNELVETFQSTLLNNLLIMAAEIDPSNPAWQRENEVFWRPFALEDRLIELEKFFANHEIVRPTSFLGCFRTAILAVADSEEWRAFGKEYRKAVLEKTRQGTIDESDRKGLNQMTLLELSRIFGLKVDQLNTFAQSNRLRELFIKTVRSAPPIPSFR